MSWALHYQLWTAAKVLSKLEERFLVLEAQLPRGHVKSAGLLANISIIVCPSGTFTSLHSLRFLQDDETISTQSYHVFYIPGDIRPWREAFNVSDFHYSIHSDRPTHDPVTLIWQSGIPPRQRSIYGTRKCHYSDWSCTQRSCPTCPKTHNWVDCKGFLNCTGEETTAVYTGSEAECSNESRETGMKCGNGANSIIIGLGIGGVPVRRNFSFWTVARHRLMKYFSSWGL